MARNTLAGKSPSYDKRGMSAASRAKKKAYDKKFGATAAQKKKRAELNKKNRDAGTYGNKDRKDWDHAVGRMVSQSKNRGRNSKNSKRTTAGDRRARG